MSIEIDEPAIIPNEGYGRMNFDARIIGWKIHYADGSVVKSSDSLGSGGQAEWNNAPSTGVIVVVLFFGQKLSETENYRRLMTGSDYFWREEVDGEIVYGQGDAFDPSIPLSPPDGQVKSSQWISDKDFKAIYDKAYNDRLW